MVRNRLFKRFLTEAEGEGFEPSSDPEARNGFRDRDEYVSVQSPWGLSAAWVCRAHEGMKGSAEGPRKRALAAFTWVGRREPSRRRAGSWRAASRAGGSRASGGRSGARSSSLPRGVRSRGRV